MPVRSRVIGRFEGFRPGPLVIVFAALHGNEPAGVAALQEVFRLLEENTAITPHDFSGKIVGVIGNCWAYAAQKRFIEKDLNRQWTAENWHNIAGADPTLLRAEAREMGELMALLEAEIADSKPQTLVFLDLHTTSADGGIFALPIQTEASHRLAQQLAAPVVLGLAEGVPGAMLHFVAEYPFDSAGPARQPAAAIAFEAGQHSDPLSVERCIAFTINALRILGCVPAEALHTSYEARLSEYSARLPKTTRLRYSHTITAADQFKMRPGYTNFQAVRRSEHLADDVRGAIYSPDNGLILMPLYQALGSDGFFIVQEV